MDATKRAQVALRAALDVLSAAKSASALDFWREALAKPLSPAEIRSWRDRYQFAFDRRGIKGMRTEELEAVQLLMALGESFDVKD